MRPVPTTAAVSPGPGGERDAAWTATARGSVKGRPHEGQALRQGVQDALGHDDIFREGPVPAVFLTGDAQHAAVVAEVHLPAAAVPALPAVLGGVEGDMVARLEAAHPGPGLDDLSGGLVSHDDGGAAAAGGPVHPVDVGAADRRGPHPYDHVPVIARYGVGYVAIREALVFLQHQGFHSCILPGRRSPPGARAQGRV